MTFNNINLANCLFPVADIVQLKKKMLNWANRFNIFCFLDNQSYSIQPHEFEILLAAGSSHSVSSGNFQIIDQFLKEHGTWTFGHLSYELKNQDRGIITGKKDPVAFPLFHFFVPEILLSVKEEGLRIHSIDPEKVYQEIMNEDVDISSGNNELFIQQRLSREAYLHKIEQLRQHILRGDCYEINFCQEFFAEAAVINPVAVYLQLMEISPNPFSVLYRLNHSYLLCASPERYLTKKGNRIISQPMKGTIKRNPDDPSEDEKLKRELRESSKEQAENVMVVDMVRNDLTRISGDASVRVDELFGIYSFPQVHQMISTISGELKEDISFSAIIDASFPMGSMTGAPKQRVMELINEYEVSCRGIFSGSVGYIDPDGNFDLNVVIRSIMYNAQNRYLSYQLGSGITFYSDPEKEWEECILKGEAIRKVLNYSQEK